MHTHLLALRSDASESQRFDQEGHRILLRDPLLHNVNRRPAARRRDKLRQPARLERALHRPDERRAAVVAALHAATPRNPASDVKSNPASDVQSNPASDGAKPQSTPQPPTTPPRVVCGRTGHHAAARVEAGRTGGARAGTRARA
eukprot:2480156-Prymnesium_polylepis.1